MSRSRRLRRFGICCVGLLILAGCGGTDTTGRTPVMGSDGTFPDSGESRQWPTEIPEEIPPFGARLIDWFGGGDTTRLSFRDVTAQHVVDYAEVLEAEGFEVEYLVYASNVNPERAEEQARRGEYEAIRASKGGYSLHLEFGGGMASLALSGFPALPIDW